MAHDDAEDRFEQHAAILRSLTAMLQAQHTFNERQVAINQDVSATLARIETLLARMLRSGDNGQDA